MADAASRPVLADDLDTLVAFLRGHRRLLVLTGAGISTESGIPDYRDVAGQWKQRQPVRHQDFLSQDAVRRRYWARSMVGWPVFRRARPNAGHGALATLEERGHVHHLLTQNVDGLHQVAGHRRVLELHGNLAWVVCMDCGGRTPRATVQQVMEAANPWLADAVARPGPDGDADLDGAPLDSFSVPACPACGGLLKPDVVFFGDNVPRHRVDEAMAALAESDALLVVGSSLMVYSGYRFCERARDLGKPVAAINLGATRADPMLAAKLAGPCGDSLVAISMALTG